MKTLAEALDAFTKEELVSFKWDKEINPETGEEKSSNWLRMRKYSTV